MDKNRILEIAQKENNDELKEKRYQRAQLIGKTSIIFALAILGFVESFRYENAIYIMIIPGIFLITVESVINVIFKKTSKRQVYLMWFEIIGLVTIITIYILKTWLNLW